MAKKRYKRRRFLIDRLQLRLLSITLLYFTAAATIFAAVLFTPLMLQLTGDPESPQARAAVATEFLALHSRFWPAILLTFALLALHSVFTSHRIAGPLYRFRIVFKEIQSGNLVPYAGIRERDLLGKEADALNAMLVSLRERLFGIFEEQRYSQEQFEHLRRAIRSDSEEDVSSHMTGLEEGLAGLGKRLGGFTLRKS